MTIRKTTLSDLPSVLDIYDAARLRMLEMGNPQWEFSHPTETMVRGDIERGNGYVLEESGKVVGAFAFIVGEDPTYEYIENGAWLNNDTYGTLHRVAGNGEAHGVMAATLAFCESQIANVRVDTHEKNLPMQHILDSAGYTRCGRIYVKDGSPRIAYQKERKTL
ncbi:MAG: N-acetyltransferase [Clostridia bacterium]|nr:N-acetyltransferase [Clostridia bacterium]